MIELIATVLFLLFALNTAGRRIPDLVDAEQSKDCA